MMVLVSNTAARHMQEKTKKIHLTAAHIRGARGLLHWTVADLAEKSGVSALTITRWENHQAKPRERTRDAVRDVCEQAGIVFTNGGEPGVKLRKTHQ